MRPAKPESYRTYTCEMEGCGVVKTVHKWTYDKSEHHFCSRKCYRLSEVRPNRKSYWYYKAIRDVGRKLARIEFIIKFDKTIYSINYKGMEC